MAVPQYSALMCCTFRRIRTTVAFASIEASKATGTVITVPYIIFKETDYEPFHPHP